MDAREFIHQYLRGRGAPAPAPPRPWNGPIHLDGFLLAARDLGLGFAPVAQAHYRLTAGGRVVGEIKNMRSNLVALEAARVCRSKARTLAALRGVCPIPEQAVFSPHQAARALRHAAARDFAVVVKPVSLAGGQGVSARICTAEDFRGAWQRAVAAIDEQGAERRIVVEEFVPGVDLRVVVVRDRVACALTRIPAHVIGTGTQTVAELVHEKQRLRAAWPHAGLYPLPVPESVEGRRLDDWVPDQGEVVILRDIANVHTGGEAFDVTDMLPDAVGRHAVRAVQAIVGLTVAAVDFQAAGFGAADRVAIIELNAYANFGLHYYPYWGQPRNPARAVIEAMLDTPMEAA